MSVKIFHILKKSVLSRRGVVGDGPRAVPLL